jgi:hypothetical protein
MTMAVGFLCRDGVVIGADRQVTAEDKFTFPECKLTSTRWGNGHGILGYAGNHDTYRAFEKLFLSAFWGDMIVERDDVASRLQEVLKATVGKKEGFQTLFGFWVDGKYQSLVTSVDNRRVLDVQECEVIGCADSPLTRFFLGTFKDVPHGITVHQARIYAVHFISQAKKYDGQYVGGPIDVYSIDMSGQNNERCVRVLDAGQTPEWERQTNLIHYWMDVLFSKLTDKDNPVAVEQFNERLNEFRNWCVPEESQAKYKTAIVLFPSTR